MVRFVFHAHTSGHVPIFLAVTVSQICYHRQTGFETWITSDGRGYLVQLYEDQDAHPSASEASTDDPQADINPFQQSRPSSGSSNSARPFQWHGTCIHHINPPRWVQKRKQVDPGDVVGYAYNEPRRAMAVTLNPKFSLVAVGTYK